MADKTTSPLSDDQSSSAPESHAEDTQPALHIQLPDFSTFQLPDLSTWQRARGTTLEELKQSGAQAFFFKHSNGAFTDSAGQTQQPAEWTTLQQLPDLTPEEEEMLKQAMNEDTLIGAMQKLHAALEVSAASVAAALYLPQFVRAANDMLHFSSISPQDAVNRLRSALSGDPIAYARSLYESFEFAARRLYQASLHSKRARKAARHAFLTHGKHGLKRPRSKRNVPKI